MNCIASWQNPTRFFSLLRKCIAQGFFFFSKAITTLLYHSRELYLCKKRFILCQKNIGFLPFWGCIFMSCTRLDWEAVWCISQRKDIFSHGCYMYVVPVYVGEMRVLYLSISPGAMRVAIPQTSIIKVSIQQHLRFLFLTLQSFVCAIYFV